MSASLASILKTRKRLYPSEGEGLFWLVAIVLTVVLSALSINFYPLFHILVELFSVIVTMAMFMLVWNARHFMDSHYLQFLGIAFFFVGGFDLMHSLSHQGMDVLAPYSNNFSVQLWIAARYMQSLSLLVAPLFFHYKCHFETVFSLYALLSAALLALMLSGLFPVTYIEGEGLTPFKIYSEYVICAILALAAWLLYYKAWQVERMVFVYLALSIVLTIFSELAFTLYTNVYGVATYLGHLLKLSAFYLIYKAIIEIGLRRPYTLLFRNLQQHADSLQSEIESRTRTEEALRASEARFRRLTENAPVMIYRYRLKPVKGFDYVNQIAFAVTGYRPEEYYADANLLAKLSTDAQCRLLKFLSDAQPPLDNPVNACWRHKQGHLIWVEHHLVPVYDEAHDLIALEGIVVDVSRRQLAEEALKQQNKHLEESVRLRTRELAESEGRARIQYKSIPVPTYTWRQHDKKIILADYNDAAENLDQGKVTRFQGCSLSEFYADCPEMQDDIRLCLAQKKPLQREISLPILNSDRRRDTLVKYAYMPPGGVLVHTEDITERKRAEIALYEALHREKDLNRLKNRFISMVSHEFRTPMTAISSSTALLQRYWPRLSDPKKYEHLDNIHNEIKYMDSMLDEVLALGRAESGKLQFNPVYFDLPSFCRELVRKSAACCKPPGAPVHFSYGENCAGMMYLDKHLLRHILSNLLSNALKYSPADKSVHFEVDCLQGWIYFRVRDQGIGIPAQEQSKIFEAFHRADNVGNISGSGLGLAIVKQYLDLHGGRIELSSTPAQGTVFTVSLPIIEAQHDDKNSGH
jgi:PAS domain S-box-containing protein